MHFFYEFTILSSVSQSFGIIESFENLMKDTDALTRNTNTPIKFTSIFSYLDMPNIHTQM